MKISLLVLLVCLFPAMVKANEITTKESLDFIMTACGGDTSSEEKQRISSNLAKLLDFDGSGNFEKTSKHQGMSGVFSVFDNEERKAEAMKFFPDCIQKMMVSMKDFLSDEQKEVLSKVITITKEPASSACQGVTLFQSATCQNVSELENIEVALVPDGATYCDKQNRFLLRFKVEDKALRAKSSGLFQIHDYHIIDSFEIRNMTFPSGKVRYFQLPFPVKENSEGKRVVQINFVPKPES